MSETRDLTDALSAHPELDVDPAQLPAAVDALADDEVVQILKTSAALATSLERVRVVAAGVVARRSSRAQGQSGLAAVDGHRSPIDMVQKISGSSRAEARRQVKLGTSLLDGDDQGELPSPPDANDQPAATDVEAGRSEGRTRWDEPLRRALLAGVITAAQHEALLWGLGEPPLPRSVAGHPDAESTDTGDEEASRLAHEAWLLAAEQLLRESAEYSVEELRRRARQVRDSLDESGAQERFDQRFDARSLRTWRDAEGRHQGHIVFDDEMGAWVDSILAAGLRPRRGGPRFMTDEERAASQDLIEDPRTNDQLAYDLLMGVLRAGSLASAEDVFGARQPGVRLVAVKDLIGPRDAFGRLTTVAHLEDGGDVLPGSMIDRALCDTGTVTVTVDSCGNPLDVGREQRLFTSKQRIALAIRDGGCRWRGCTVPASYCEAHHIDHWCDDGGRTDVDRGILLCRFHHLLLHNQGWRIRRDHNSEFMLHPPAGRSNPPVPLPSGSAIRWAWDPPPPLMRKHWRAA
nr:HNH endonuclease signature motif containing protein [Microbacterium bovistercoris]